MISTGQNEEVAILVVSFDGYQDLWEPFFTCFFEHWPQCPYTVYLGSNKTRYADERVTPILVGEDRDYSTNLLAMLAEIRQEWIIIFVEDIFLTSRVSTQRIHEIVAFAQTERAAHVQLIYRPFQHTNLLSESLETAKPAFPIPIGVPYRVSINLCLWRKSTLIEILRPGESVWEVENCGTIRSFNLADKFFAVSKYSPAPLGGWIHGVIKRQWTWEAARFLRQKKFRHNWEKRSVQSFYSYCYLNVYIVLRYAAFWIMYRISGNAGMMKLVSHRKW